MSAIISTYKIADKSFTDIGEIISYNIMLVNKGDTSANNILFIDTIPNNTSLIYGSFKQDGINIDGSSNPPGITLPNSIDSNGVSIIVYQVLVNNKPILNSIPNNSTIRYSGTYISTDTVYTTVNFVDLSSISQSVDKELAKISDILTYTITIPNKGSVSAYNLTFINTIPNGTNFVADSIIINGFEQIGLIVSPPNGLYLGTLEAESTLTLSFKLSVTTVPNPDPIPNMAYISYNYIVNTSFGDTIPASINTNTVYTQYDNGNLSIIGTNYVDKSFATINDKLTYTIILKNFGNKTATNVMISDSIPNDTIFEPESVFINNKQDSTTIPVEDVLRINMGSINSKGLATLSFKVNVNTIPNPNPIINNPTIMFNYTLPDYISLFTNTVSTQINYADLINSSQSVSKYFAGLYDILTYTITIPNTGTVTVNNVLFLNTIPKGTIFVDNSVLVNGIIRDNSTVAPPNGLNIGDIGANSFVTLSFDVIVNTLPSPNPFSNSSNITYSYIVNPDSNTTLSKSNNTNSVNTEVNFANLENISKSVDKSDSIVGGTLTYTVTISNSGNLTANNVLFIDTIPNGTVFIEDSVLLNGLQKYGEVVFPPNGLYLGSIIPNSFVTLSFKVTIDTIPYFNPIPNSSYVNYNYTVNPILGSTLSAINNSNTVYTSVGNIHLGLLLDKTTDKTFPDLGDNLSYTIVVKNRDIYSIGGIVITDTIPINTTFVSNILNVNGVSLPGSPASPNGVSLGTLSGGAISTISFSVLVTNATPNPNTIFNTAKGQYNYSNQIFTVNSNIVVTSINVFTVSVPAYKMVDKLVAEVGESITYNIMLPNKGNTTIDRILFIDTIPDYAFIVPGTFKQDGIDIIGDCNFHGVILPNSIPPYEVSSIIYQAIVKDLPSKNSISNVSTFRFDYTTDPSIPNGMSKNYSTQSVTTQISYINLSSISNYVDKQSSKISNTLTYTVTIPNQGNINVSNVVFISTIPNGTSFVSNSILVNGSIKNGATVAPPNGLSIGTIKAKSTTTLSFKLSIETIPSPNPIPNSSYINYNYVLDASVGEILSKSNNTNTVYTSVDTVNLGLLLDKSVDKSYSDLATTLSYTIIAKNRATYPIGNVIVTDSIPANTTFVDNSLTLNGIKIEGSPQPPFGVNLGTISSNVVSTISFIVTTGNTVPNPNIISNFATCEYNDSNQLLTVTSKTAVTTITTVSVPAYKMVDKFFADIGEIVTYSVIIPNMCNITVNRILFIDTIPSNTSLIPGSFKQDGFDIIGSSNYPGVVLPNGIPINEVSVIIYKVVINKLPLENPMSSISTFRFYYDLDSTSSNEGSQTYYTQSVSTKINFADFSNISKSVDKDLAKISDVLTYSISIPNDGNATANNVTFIDTIPNGTKFIENSLIVNGIERNYSAMNLNNGIDLGSLEAGSSITLSFNVSVVTMPDPDPIPNVGYVNYNYIVDSYLGDTISKSNNTNSVFTQYDTGNLSVIGSKYVDKVYAALNDKLTYTVVLKNFGKTIARNVVIKNNILSNTTFEPQSVFINNVQNITTLPVGNVLIISMGNLSFRQTATLSFKVKINTIPTYNPMDSSSNFIFNYTLPDMMSIFTNTVSTYVNNANLSNISNSVNKHFAGLYDILTYVITIPNTGNVNAHNVFFINTIPNDTVFVQNSILINGFEISDKTINPSNGLNIGTIEANSFTTLSFKVSVNNLPTPNYISSSGRVIYNYILNTDSNVIVSESNISNVVYTKVNFANLESISKSVNKSRAVISDTLTYTITIPNIGNVTAKDVIFIDTLPSGTNFVSNSVLVNGIVRNGDTVVPPNGLSLGNIIPNTFITLSFNVTIDSIPQFNPLPNSGYVNYNYIVDNNTTLLSSNNSNSAYTNVEGLNLGLGLNKFVDKYYCDLRDTLSYTIVVKNRDIYSTNNIVVTDTIPINTTFVENSLNVNGISVSGSPAPPNGVSIGTLGGGAISTITFSSLVTNIVPKPNIISNLAIAKYNSSNQIVTINSNVVVTTVNTFYVSVPAYKLVDKGFAEVGEVITYSIILPNKGNTTIDRILFVDTIPSGTYLLPNSFKQDGFDVVGSSNPPGVILPNSIPPDEVSNIIYQVMVNSNPIQNPIYGTSTFRFDYTVDPSVPNGMYKMYSTQSVSTQINFVDLSSISQNVDKLVAELSDILTYTVIIPNNGNINATDVTFIDTIPDGTNFIENSLVVNGSQRIGKVVSPPNGINLGTLSPNSKVTLSFKVIINNMPIPITISNSGYVNYNYTVDTSFGDTISGSDNTNIVDTKYSTTSLGFFGINDVDKKFADLNDSLNYIINLSNNDNLTVNNVIIEDTIPNGTVFKSGSVFIDNVPYATTPVGNVLRLSIDTIEPNKLVSLTFAVNITTIPSPNPIINSANIRYNYTNSITKYTNTDVAITKVNSAILGNVSKSVSSLYATSKDILTYTITIPNIGNITATNILLYDTIPSGTTFVSNSVIINGSQRFGANPELGLNISDIAPNSTTTLSFKVIVN